MRKMLLVACVALLASVCQANPVCEVNRTKAKEDLKQELLVRYGNSYSTVKMLLDAGMRDYETLCQLPENSVNNGILRDLKDRYYPSFSTILMLYKANKKSYDELSN